MSVSSGKGGNTNGSGKRPPHSPPPSPLSGRARGNGGDMSDKQLAHFIDRGEVLRALSLLVVDSSQATELRILKSGKSPVLPSADLDAIASAAIDLVRDSGGDFSGIYVGLNARNISLVGAGRSGRKADIVSRRWLLCDLDPVRPADSNSTDSEHETAREVGDLVTDFLCGEQHWPAPIRASSGNGHHLLFRLDLSTSDEDTQLVKSVLKIVSERFGCSDAGEGVEIDTKVHDLPRICKLYGSLSRKGPHSEQRPHRMARLLDVPDQIGVTDRSLLVALVEQFGDGGTTKKKKSSMTAAAAPVAVPSTPSVAAATPPVRQVPTATTSHPLNGIAVNGPTETDVKSAYARSALERECQAVASEPVDGENRNNRLNIAAFSLGQLVAAGAITESEVVAGLMQAAAACELPTGEAARTIRSGLEAGRTKPRDLSGVGQQQQQQAGYASTSKRQTADTSSNGNATTTAPAADPDEPPPWDDIVPAWDLPETEPFPLEEVFPPRLVDYAREVAWAVSCPVDFVAVLMLGVASGAIGASRELAITRTHKQSALLYLCAIGLPGSGKSPALKEVSRPLVEAQRRYRRTWLAQNKRYKAELKADPKAATPPGPMRRVLADDATGESLLALLVSSPRGLALVKDELASLFTGLNQYKGGKGSDRQVFLQLWSQGAVVIDRKGGEQGPGVPLWVTRPYCAIVGGLQPDVVGYIRGQFNLGQAEPPGGPFSTAVRPPPPNDGFLDRFLYSYPVPGRTVGETWREVSEHAEASWQMVIDCLLDLEQEAEPGVADSEDNDSKRPRRLHLSECGKSAWQAFTFEHADEVNDEELFAPHLHGPWSKLRGYCARLALVIHLLRQVSGDDSLADPALVDGDSVSRAVRLINYFKAHLRKVLHAMDADRAVLQARRILRWIERENRGSFKRYEVFRDCRSRSLFSTPESLNAPLNRLVSLNVLRRVEAANAPRGGRPGRPESEVFLVHPEAIPLIRETLRLDEEREREERRQQEPSTTFPPAVHEEDERVM